MEQKPHLHSGPGLASFLLGILTSVLVAATLVVYQGAEHYIPGGVDAHRPLGEILVVVVLVLLSLAFLGLGLGIAGLFQKDRRKIFPVLGTLFSLVPPLIAAFGIAGVLLQG